MFERFIKVGLSPTFTGMATWTLKAKYETVDDSRFSASVWDWVRLLMGMGRLAAGGTVDVAEDPGRTADRSLLVAAGGGPVIVIVEVSRGSDKI
jgi:hypothetical protein